MSLKWNESVFTFPFSFKGGLRKWENYYEDNGLYESWSWAQEIDSKYYLKYIYNDENRPNHYEYTQNNPDWNYSNVIHVKTALTGNDETMEYQVKMIGLSLFIFPTGVGFLTVRVRYPEGTTARSIANFSAAFSRIFANEYSDRDGRITCYINGKRCYFTGFLKELIEKGEGKIIFFPCSNNEKSFVFHRLVLNHVTEREKWALRRNLWVTDGQGDADEITPLEKVVAIDNVRYYMLSSTVMCVISKDTVMNEQEMEKLQKNIRFSYFNLYMLCIHEQQGVLLYNQDEVAIGKNYKEAKAIKNDLLRFLPSYSFRVVSTEMIYQQIFLDLQQILNLRELESNLRDNISMLETAYEQEQDRKVNFLLTILAVMGLVSVAADFMQLVNFFIE